MGLNLSPELHKIHKEFYAHFPLIAKALSKWFYLTETEEFFLGIISGKSKDIKCYYLTGLHNNSIDLTFRDTTGYFPKEDDVSIGLRYEANGSITTMWNEGLGKSFQAHKKIREYFQDLYYYSLK